VLINIGTFLFYNTKDLLTNIKINNGMYMHWIEYHSQQICKYYIDKNNYKQWYLILIKNVFKCPRNSKLIYMKTGLFNNLNNIIDWLLINYKQCYLILIGNVWSFQETSIYGKRSLLFNIKCK
jgi:hypothetical protein